MPHDLPPSWLERQPHIRRAFYWALALATIGALVIMFGPDWVRAKLDLLLNHYLGMGSAPTTGV